jgi:hypothetical protein
MYTSNARRHSSSGRAWGRIAGVRALQKIAVIAFVAAAAYVVWWRVQVASDPVEATVETAADADGGREVETSRATQATTSPGAPVERLIAYAEQFDTANDHAPFADAMHKLALAGDDAAQYWLYRALQRCGPIYDAIFEVDPARPDQPPLRLDEAVANELANPSLGADEVREMHAQCQQLRGVDRSRYGDPANWLKRAAQSGYPLAQVRRAAELALGVDGAPNRADARELVRAAVRSGDPDVLLQTGAVAQMLAEGESARERHEWVWEVAACQRGANCGPTSEYVRGLCALDKKCQPYETAIDVIRRRVGAQLPEVEEEARQLNAHIDAREWGALGL